MRRLVSSKAATKEQESDVNLIVMSRHADWGDCTTARRRDVKRCQESELSLRRGLEACAVKSGLYCLPGFCFGKIAINVGDFSVGKVSSDRVHFAVVILDSLFDDLWAIA